jgi:hypothetical protein
MNTVDALCNGDILKWESILQLPYEKVYVKLLMNKATNKYQERYSEIIRRKNS